MTTPSVAALAGAFYILAVWRGDRGLGTVSFTLSESELTCGVVHINRPLRQA